MAYNLGIFDTLGRSNTAPMKRRLPPTHRGRIFFVRLLRKCCRFHLNAVVATTAWALLHQALSLSLYKHSVCFLSSRQGMEVGEKQKTKQKTDIQHTQARFYLFRQFIRTQGAVFCDFFAKWTQSVYDRNVNPYCTTNAERRTKMRGILTVTHEEDALHAAWCTKPPCKKKERANCIKIVAKLLLFQVYQVRSTVRPGLGLMSTEAPTAFFTNPPTHDTHTHTTIDAPSKLPPVQ